jgi:YgiT-type zinc finger domain-containing protein
MTCPICTHGKTVKGFTTLVFQKGCFTIIVKNVPGEICDLCGEAVISESVSNRVLDLTRNEEVRGTPVQMLKYASKCTAA